MKSKGKKCVRLGHEVDKAFALLTSLDETQRKQAILGFQIRDLVLGPGHDGQTIQPEGIKGADLTEQAARNAPRFGERMDRNHAPIGRRRENGRDEKERRRYVVRLERPDGKGRGGVLPHPRADACSLNLLRNDWVET